MRLGGKGGGGPRNNLPFPTFFEGRNYQIFTFFKKVLNAFFWLLTCISFNWKEFVLYGRIPHKNTFLAGVKMKVGGGVEVVVGLFPPSSFLFLAPFTFGIIVIRERRRRRGETPSWEEEGEEEMETSSSPYTTTTFSAKPILRNMRCPGIAIRRKNMVTTYFLANLKNLR